MVDQSRLQAQVPLSSAGADDQQVRLGGCLQQGLACRPLDHPSAHRGVAVLLRRVPQGVVQYLRRRAPVGLQGVPRRGLRCGESTERCAPGVHRHQPAATHISLAERELHGRAAALSLLDAVMQHRNCRAPFTHEAQTPLPTQQVNGQSGNPWSMPTVGTDRAHPRKRVAAPVLRVAVVTGGCCNSGSVVDSRGGVRARSMEIVPISIVSRR